MCDEIWHCRNVEAFQQYLSSMLREVFLRRPETLPSSEAVKLSDVLACSDMAKVVRTFAERKVDGLSYQRFDDLMAYLKNTMGPPFQSEQVVLTAAKEAVEVRNIVVHNAVVVNRTFIGRTGRGDLLEGQAFPLDQDYVLKSGKMMGALVEELDAAFIDHFRLRFDPSPRGEPA